MNQGSAFSEKSSLLTREVAPLKESPIMLLVTLFEVLLVTTSLFYMPNLVDDCPDSRLWLWLSLTVVVCGAHLLLSGAVSIVRQIKGVEASSMWALKIVHSTIIAVIMGWVMVGHYWLFVQGISCSNTEVFVAAAIVAVVLDALAVAFILSLVVSSLSMWCKPRS